MGGVFFPGQEGIFCVQKMVRNYRRSASRGTILCVTNGCQLRSRSPSVRWLSRLGAHANLDWARRVCVDFAVGITAAVVKWEFMDSRQADQASAEPRGTPTWGNMSVGRAGPRGIELLYVRASGACLPTPLNYRSGQGVSPGRDGRVGRMVKMSRSQCRASMRYLCVGVNWRWVSVMWCRRQWHGLSTVFGPSRVRVRFYYECTRLASIRVGVVRVSRAISHGRRRRGGWDRVLGARRCRGLSRGCSYVWCMR